MAKKEKERKRKNPKVDLYTLISLFLFFLPLKKRGVYQKNEQKSREYDRPSMSHWLIFKGKEL